jgi:hypothetical protein
MQALKIFFAGASTGARSRVFASAQNSVVKAEDWTGTWLAWQQREQGFRVSSGSGEQGGWLW